MRTFELRAEKGPAAEALKDANWRFFAIRQRGSGNDEGLFESVLAGVDRVRQHVSEGEPRGAW